MQETGLFTIAAVLNGNLGGPSWATILLAVIAGLVLVRSYQRRPPAGGAELGPLVPARRELD